MTQTLTRSPVTQIVLHRVEGRPRDCKRVCCTSWREAHNELVRWSLSAPKDGTYHKCDFKVTWENGETYEGRYDLKHLDAAPVDLNGQILNYLLFLAGLRRPAWMDDAQWAASQAAHADDRPIAQNTLNAVDLPAVAY